LSSNTNIGSTPVNQGYVQLIHTGETGGIDGTLRTLYDGDGTASDLQIASNKVKVSTALYIGSDTLQEYIQDTVGAMLVTNASHTNLSAAYDDAGDGAIDLTATGAVSGITGGTGIDATGSGNITIAIDSTVATLTGSQTLSNKTLAAPTLTGTTQGASITLSGDLTVNGTTTTVNQTNLDVSDNIIGLNRGASSNANDSGLIIERGSTGDNAAIIWDESADKFTMGTTTSTPSATGNLTITAGTLVAALEGNASTATGLANGRTISLTGDVTGTSGSFDGTGNVSLAATIAANSVALGTDTTGNYVGTITAGTGVATTGASTGEGIAHSISISAGQTAITSIYNSSLEIGSASDGQVIDFGTSDEIRLGSSSQTSVKIKTDPLGSAQDEVIIGDGSADVDFVVDNSSGTTVFKVDAGTGNTAVTGDLSISGSFSPSTLTASTSVRTPLIEFTDGDDAISIANGGAMTFAKGFSVTSGASSFGANVDIKSSGGSILQLNTSSTDVDSAGVLGRINFSAPDESAGSDSNLLAASIIAKATADFTATSNQTDMVFELGVSETASEKFRIFSSGGIKIGNAYTLPSSDGSANQILKTNGSGTLSFADESGGISFDGSTANGVLTYKDSDEATVESTLTWAGQYLDITSNDGAEGGVRLNKSTMDGTHIRYHISHRDDNQTLIVYSYDGTTFRNWITLDEPNALLKLGSNSSNLCDIDDSGNFRFANQVEFEDTNAVINRVSNDLEIRTYGGYDINLMAAGNVGIGTTSPAQDLTIYEDSGDCNVLISSNNGASQIFFGDTEDDNIGIIRYDHSSNFMKFTTNTGDAMTIDSSQKVGIGTTSPGAKFTVRKDGTQASSVSTTYQIQTVSNSNGGIAIQAGDSSHGYLVFGDNGNYDAGRIAYGNSSGAMGFWTADTERMRINSTGLGIGTTSPSYLLDVHGVGRIYSPSGDADLRMESGYSSNTTSFLLRNGAGNNRVDFMVGGANAMTINSSQKVGIGTTSPDNVLHVKHATTNVVAKFESGDTLSYINLIDNAADTYGVLLGVTGNDFHITTGNASGTTISERLRVKSDGKVGIGTSSPSYLLHLSGTAPELAFTDTDGSATWRTRAVTNNFHITETGAGDPFVIESGAGANALRIDSSGNVGIGTSSPSFGLQIDGSNFGGDSFKITRGTSAFTILNANNSYGVLGMESNDDLQIRTNGTTRMTIDNSGNVLIGGTSVSGHGFNFEVLNDHAFVKGPDGWDGNGDKAIVALGSAVSNESFGCGYVYGTGLVLSTYKTSGGGHFGSSTQNSLVIADTTGQASFINDVIAYASSDKRLKENVKPLDNALDKINKINGIEFDWIDGKDEHGNSVHSNQGHDVGVIAQEIEEVLPEVVHTRDNGYKAVKYEKIVPLLIQAIKEQQQQIEELKNG